MTRNGLLLIALALLFPLAPGGTALAEEGPHELTLEKAKIRFKANRPGRDRIKLVARFPSQKLPRDFDVRGSDVEVMAGPAAAISFPPLDDRARLKKKDEWHFVYRERRSKVRAGVRKMKIDLAAGRIVLRAKRLDLSALRAAGPGAVSVKLTLGGTVFAGAADLERKGTRWKYREVRRNAPFVPRVPGPGGPGGGGDPGGDPSGGPLALRVLSSDYIAGSPNAQTTVLRTRTDYYDYWFQRFPPPPPGLGVPVVAPPNVDFSREIVVAIEIGTRPTGGYAVSVTGVTAEGSGARVDWEERQPGTNCIVTQALTRPLVIAAITRVDGAVTFRGSVRVVNCP